MRKYCIPALFFLGPALLGASSVVAVQMPTSIAQPPKPAARAGSKPVSKTADKPASKPDAPLLPASFSGWDSASATQPTPKPVIDPALADSASAVALKEYGFTDALLRDYSRDGETLKIKALRFTDASGAYGAYSYYRQSGWPREEIGTGTPPPHSWVSSVSLRIGIHLQSKLQ